MLEDAQIVDDKLVIWDIDGRPAVEIPLPFPVGFDPGIAATEILSTMLQTEAYQAIPMEDMAHMAANAAKIIRDVLTQEQEEV